MSVLEVVSICTRLLNMASITADGYQYFPDSGLKPGLPTQAVITPSSRNVESDKTYDVIVIGAGYAGLIASRELASRGTWLPDAICGDRCLNDADSF